MDLTVTKTQRTTVPRDDKPSMGAGPVIPLEWSREEIEKHLAQLGITPQKRLFVPSVKRGGV